MTQQLADHGKALTKRERTRGEAVSQIVDPYVLQSGALSDAFPGRLKIAKVSS